MLASKKQMRKIDRLKKRSDFLRAKESGVKWTARGLSLQVAENGEAERVRFGITVSKHIDKSAVRRNRLKRRLRAAAFDVLPSFAAKGRNYVLLGRKETMERPYADLCRDLKWCLGKLDLLEKKQADDAELPP